VEDTLVKAKLIDRWTASQIYEGIVKRRQDPSIFYKNNATAYEFRVFPLIGSKTRKVKISWMEPIGWTEKNTNNLLPFNMLNNPWSSTKMNIKILMDNEWKNPRINFENPIISDNFSVTQDAIYGQIYHGTFSFKDLLKNASYYLSYDNPMVNGSYLKAYKEDFENGFFEFSILPTKAFDLKFLKNTLFIIDYDLSYSNVQFTDMISGLKNLILNNFTAADSFNIVINRYQLVPLRDKWISATPENINQMFDELTMNKFTLYSLLPQLLLNAQTFIDNNLSQNTMINIISTSETFGKQEIANYIINNFRKDAKHIVPINICDFSYASSQTKISGYTFYGNEYLYTNLAKLTGGEFFGKKQSLQSGLGKITQSLQPNFIDIELKTSLDNGFTYSKYLINQMNFNISTPLTLSGKYFGSGKFTAELTGVIQADKLIPVHKKVEFSDYDLTNKSSKTVWIGQYIRNLEKQTKTNATVAEIIETSMENRVLSLHTAFLALEPWMTGESQGNDGNEGTGTVVQEDENVLFEAYPNPFTRQVKVNVCLKEAGDNITGIEIYNSNGHMVNSIDISQFAGSNVFYFIWDGKSMSGSQLPNGAYLMVIKTKKLVKTFKLILNR
jgi:hypothetical protein